MMVSSSAPQLPHGSRTISWYMHAFCRCSLGGTTFMGSNAHSAFMHLRLTCADAIAAVRLRARSASGSGSSSDSESSPRSGNPLSDVDAGKGGRELDDEWAGSGGLDAWKGGGGAGCDWGCCGGWGCEGGVDVCMSCCCNCCSRCNCWICCGVRSRLSDAVLDDADGCGFSPADATGWAGALDDVSGGGGDTGWCGDGVTLIWKRAVPPPPPPGAAADEDADKGEGAVAKRCSDCGGR